VVVAAFSMAICLVITIQWHLVLNHVNRNPAAGHDGLFLSSFAAAVPSSTSRTGRQAGHAGGRITRSQPTDRAHDGEPAYITSEICGGCTRSFFDHRHCYTIMERDAKQMTMAEAAIKLGNESENCKLCHPRRCREHYFGPGGGDITNSTSMMRSKFWRFDRANPRIKNPSTIKFDSIPDSLRIPPERYDDIGAYFVEKFERSIAHNTSMDYLVEYNPGIVIIPEGMRQYLPPEAVYLLSMRITPANNCFASRKYADLPKDVWDAVYYTSTNHLGLALLDVEMNILPGYNVAIELDVPLHLKRSASPGVQFSPTFMDYRLFVLNREIYLHINADTVILSRISLRTKGREGYNDPSIEKCDIVAADALERDEGWGNFENACKLDNIYGGDKLQVLLMRQFNTIWAGGVNGKNFALFSTPNEDASKPDNVFAEVDIFPHRVQQILPEEYQQMTKFQVFEKIWKPYTKKKRRFPLDRVNARHMREVGNITESDDAPLPSYFTVDAHPEWFPGAEAPFKTAAHGGACCVLLSKEELGGNHNEPLFVGIGHTKVIWKPWYNKDKIPQEKKDRVPHTHYVSLFYAFETQAPFRIRARSGYFCLGHAPPSDADGKLPTGEGGTFNPHSTLTRSRMLLQNNKVFDCPQMHFVSSFIEKANEPETAIIGYGLNDCYGRLVQVSKSEIVRLLYPDPLDMVFA